MKQRVIKAGIILGLLVLFTLLANVTKTPLLSEILEGKYISILGDSISTYIGYSNNESDNETLKDNKVYYKGDNILTSVEETWWKLIEKETNLKVLVNNSYSGSKVFNSGKSKSEGWKDRSENLHNSSDVNPDIVSIYLGTNDARTDLEPGELELIDLSNYIINNFDGTYTYETPKTFAQAYAIMLHKIIVKYKNPDLFCFTIIPYDTHMKVSEYNNVIRIVSAQFNCNIVDLENYKDLTNALENDVFGVTVHPNEKGMKLIADAFRDTLEKVYIEKN